MLMPFMIFSFVATLAVFAWAIYYFFAITSKIEGQSVTIGVQSEGEQSDEFIQHLEKNKHKILALQGYGVS